MYLKWTAERTDRLKELYPVTNNWNTLEKEFPFSTKRGIQGKATSLGLRKPRLTNAIHRYNTDLFRNWTETSTYLLGYLEADGYINFSKPAIRIAFAVSNKDIQLLKKLKETTGWTGRIGESDVKIRDKRYKMSRFTISSRDWKDSLLTKYYRKKKIPPIPRELLHHYMRGYFDGDGSIFWSKQAKHERSNFVFSSIELAEDFASFLRPIVQAKLTVYKKTSSDYCWYLSLGNEATKRLVRYMYRDANIYLERKHRLASKHL